MTPLSPQRARELAAAPYTYERSAARRRTDRTIIPDVGLSVSARSEAPFGPFYDEEQVSGRS